MKKYTVAIAAFLFTMAVPKTFAQTISQQLNSFSPLAGIFLKHFGLEDRNSNGVIDKGAGEGYEEFIARYGNADIGFFINGITQGANNGKLEENEIINFYYTRIRFNKKFEKETATLEKEVNAYMYANSIPLVWLDDREGTVMNATNNILGMGWNEKEVSEDEAVKMFRHVMQSLRIRGLTGDPFVTGYNQLPEFIKYRTSYCYETAQFGFWFFSQLKLNSTMVRAALTSSLLHDVVKLTDTNRIVDYFNTSATYRTKDWYILNPIQAISEYYIVQAKKEKISDYLEQAVVYNKYDLTAVGLLMYADTSNYNRIIALGEFILPNIDIEKIMQAKHLEAETIKRNLRIILLLLLKSYGLTGNPNKFQDIENISKQYFGNDTQVKQYIEFYRP